MKNLVIIIAIIVILAAAVVLLWSNDVSEIAPTEEEMDLTEGVAELNIGGTLAMIPGRWQSTDDEKSVVIFNGDGIAVDIYDGEELGSGTWELYENENAEYNPSGVFMRQIIGGESFEYAVLELSEDTLLLSYLARGNTLEYERVE